MNCSDYTVEYPGDACRRDQHEEYFILKTDQGSERLRIHDYDKVYQVPGLYEEVVYQRLKCDSPRMISDLFAEEIKADGGGNGDLRALDFGAGNGISGEHLTEKFECQTLIGLDNIKEARDAAYRDRPDIYDKYYVMDMAAPSEEDLRKLKKWNFNLLLTVAALGFGDIPTQGFINAFNLIQKDGWVAFNIKDRFMSDKDETGYSETLDAMMGSSLEVLNTHTYCHRLSMSGDPLHYCAVIGRKRDDVALS